MHAIARNRSAMAAVVVILAVIGPGWWPPPGDDPGTDRPPGGLRRSRRPGARTGDAGESATRTREEVVGGTVPTKSRPAVRPGVVRRPGPRRGVRRRQVRRRRPSRAGGCCGRRPTPPDDRHHTTDDNTELRRGVRGPDAGTASRPGAAGADPGSGAAGERGRLPDRADRRARVHLGRRGRGEGAGRDLRSGAARHRRCGQRRRGRRLPGRCRGLPLLRRRPHAGEPVRLVVRAPDRRPGPGRVPRPEPTCSPCHPTSATTCGSRSATPAPPPRSPSPGPSMAEQTRPGHVSGPVGAARPGLLWLHPRSRTYQNLWG